MTFRDPEVQEHYKRAVALAFEWPPESFQELLPVDGLMDSWYWFIMKEGEHSPKVAEVVEHLLSPELRPALRQWYKRWASCMDKDAISLRDRLSGLAGEKFG
jgi:hypothetical protein